MGKIFAIALLFFPSLGFALTVNDDYIEFTLPSCATNFESAGELQQWPYVGEFEGYHKFRNPKASVEQDYFDNDTTWRIGQDSISNDWEYSGGDVDHASGQYTLTGYQNNSCTDEVLTVVHKTGGIPEPIVEIDRNIEFGLAIIIAFMSFGLIGFVFNSMARKKAWNR